MERYFFFGEAETRIHNRFADLYHPSANQSVSIAAGSEDLEKRYGTYLTLKRIAESPVLLKVELGVSPINSALNVPLYEALTYLSAENAQSAYENRYFEELSKRRK